MSVAKFYHIRFEETRHWVLERPNFTEKCFKQLYPEAFMTIG
jgi:hypothetical protein